MAQDEDLDWPDTGDVAAVAQAATDGIAADLDPDQQVGAGVGDRDEPVSGGEVAVGQHDHPGVQGAQEMVGVGGFPGPVGAEGGVDDGAGAARHQGQHPGQGVAGAALVAAALVDPQVRGGVGAA